MGAYLATHRLRHGELVRLAERVGVSTRALREWRARAGQVGPVRPAHRPRASAPTAEVEVKANELWRALLRGHDGWRTLLCELVRAGIALARRLVQALVRRFKRERAERAKERIERERVHTDVQARDALWSCDESFLTRDERGETRALALRETCVPLTPWLSIGPPARSADVVRALERTAEVRGAWPFVVAFDNAKVNKSHAVARTLAEHRVIALLNLEHTPQHNAFVERGIGDLKLAAGLDAHAERGADPVQAPVRVSEPGVLETRASLRAHLLSIRDALDHTPRYALGGSTPAEIDSRAPRAEDRARRDDFYADARAALERVAALQLDRRARRRAERDAIFSTLEKHGLVVRTRGGGQSSRPSNRNRFV